MLPNPRVGGVGAPTLGNYPCRRKAGRAGTAKQQREQNNEDDERGRRLGDAGSPPASVADGGRASKNPRGGPRRVKGGPLPS